MIAITYKDLPYLREKHRDKKIVFCSGSFDLLHAGHALFMEDCKNLGDILVVAVGPDKDISKNKGMGRPIVNEGARLKLVSSLRTVDYAFISNSSLPDAHWLSPIEEIFEYFKPDIWAVNNDGGELEYREALALKLGIQFVVLKRVAPPEYEGISTTSILKKISDL